MVLVIDWSFWLTIVSIVATAVFGVWAIILAKSWSYPGQITYFRGKPIRLFDDITGSLAHLTVSYKGEPVQKNLTLLKGFLVNTGRKDITNEMVEKALTFQLMDGYRWLEVSARASTDGDERAKIVNLKTVVFSLGLFRCNEFIRFEALVEVSDGTAWASEMFTHHRIADTATLRVKPVPAKPVRLSSTLWRGLLAIMLVGLMVVAELYVTPVTPPHIMRAVIWSLVLALVLCIFILAVVDSRRARKIRQILKIESE
jgi:hypothetical protein